MSVCVFEGVGLTIQYRKCKDGGQWTGGGIINIYY